MEDSTDTAALPLVLAAIARRYFGTDKLEPQNSDRTDFKEVSVQNLKAALEAAFEAGKAAR